MSSGMILGESTIPQKWTDKEKLSFLFCRMCPDFVERDNYIIAGKRRFFFSIKGNIIHIQDEEFFKEKRNI